MAEVTISYRHGRKSRGEESPEFGVGDANANCAPRFCHVSKCQALDCLHYKLQYSKKLTNPMILTEYSLLPKSSLHLQRPPKHHFRRKIQHFSDEDTDKNRLRMHQNKPFQVRNSIFLPDPFPGEEGHPLLTPHSSPHEAFFGSASTNSIPTEFCEELHEHIDAIGGFWVRVSWYVTDIGLVVCTIHACVSQHASCS